jgi:tetratricopeptide (TPR) repeat protein
LIELYLKQNKIEQAEEFGQMALELAQMDQSDERREAHILKNLAEAARFTGNWHQAVEYLQKAANSFRIQNHPVYLARCLNDLGISYLQGEDFAKAERAFEEAGQIFQGTINEIDKARIYLNLGVLFYRQKKWEKAAEAFLQISPVALREQHEFNLLADLYNNLGNVYLKMERWEKASEYLNLAIEIFRHRDNELDLGNSLGTLASVYEQNGKQTEALQLYGEAIKLLQRFSESQRAQNLLSKFLQGYERLLAEI